MLQSLQSWSVGTIILKNVDFPILYVPRLRHGFRNFGPWFLKNVELSTSKGPITSALWAPGCWKINVSWIPGPKNFRILGPRVLKNQRFLTSRAQSFLILTLDVRHLPMQISGLWAGAFWICGTPSKDRALILHLTSCKYCLKSLKLLFKTFSEDFPKNFGKKKTAWFHFKNRVDYQSAVRAT